MANEYVDGTSGVRLFGGFEGASFESVLGVRDGAFDVQSLEEANVPELALNQVFYDYSFAIGVHNPAASAQEVKVRLRLCERSARRNLKFMAGPYWVKQGRNWRHLLPSAHAHGDDWVDTTFRLDPGERTILSTKPIWTSAETEEVLREYEERLPFAHVRSLGQTDEGRDLWMIETEPRDERIFVHSSFQSAEFGGDTVLHLLDWLGTPTKRSARLLERFQFQILPVPMPDGVAHGHSIMNARGRCPMFDFGLASCGEACAEESRHTWNHLIREPPVLLLDVHVHPGMTDSPKLNPVKGSSFPDRDSAKRAATAEEAMLSCCPEWRIVAVPLDDPEFSMEDSLLVLAADQFGSAAFCFQDYALTHEGGKPLLIDILDAALGVL